MPCTASSSTSGVPITHQPHQTSRRTHARFADVTSTGCKLESTRMAKMRNTASAIHSLRCSRPRPHSILSCLYATLQKVSHARLGQFPRLLNPSYRANDGTRCARHFLGKNILEFTKTLCDPDVWRLTHDYRPWEPRLVSLGSDWQTSSSSECMTRCTTTYPRQ
ncbi:unnamed protein product [Ectocarpus fasciculatus]